MALTIGVVLGEDFYVGDTRVVVEDILSPTQSKVKVIGMGIDKLFTITDQYSVEIMPGVKVSSGRKGTMDKARLAIEAHRNLKILRGDLYREDKANEGKS